MYSNIFQTPTGLELRVSTPVMTASADANPDSFRSSTGNASASTSVTNDGRHSRRLHHITPHELWLAAGPGRLSCQWPELEYWDNFDKGLPRYSNYEGVVIPSLPSNQLVLASLGMQYGTLLPENMRQNPPSHRAQQKRLSFP